MTKEEKLLIDAFQRLAQEAAAQLLLTRVCKVTAVDAGTYTCTVTVNDDTTIEGVRLRAVVNNGSPFVMTPVVNSYVLIGKVEDGTDWMVLAFDQVDQVIWNANQITMNGGNNAGLVILSKLNDNLTAIKNYLATLVTATQTGISTCGGSNSSGAAAVFGTTMAAAQLTFENMEDTKVKH